MECMTEKSFASIKFHDANVILLQKETIALAPVRFACYLSAFLIASTLSVFSQGNWLRPKCPYDAVA